MRDLRPPDSRPRTLGGGVGNYRERPLLDGSVDVAIAIGSLAAHRNEKISRGHFARIILHARDLSLAGAGPHVDSAQDVRKLHVIASTCQKKAAQTRRRAPHSTC